MQQAIEALFSVNKTQGIDDIKCDKPRYKPKLNDIVEEERTGATLVSNIHEVELGVRGKQLHW